MKHTPGPWKFLPRESRFRPAVQRGTEGAFSVSGLTNEREDADAILIAAAPDLLEALQLCREHMYNHASNTPDNAFDKLCAAIAKATGDTQ
jgi:hypothetical protein